MKNYYLFCGIEGGHNKGWGDYLGSFESVEETLYNLTKDCDWFQIVQIDIGYIVASGERFDDDNKNWLFYDAINGKHFDAAKSGSTLRIGKLKN